MHLDPNFIKIGPLEPIFENRRIATKKASFLGYLENGNFSKIGTSGPILIKLGSKCINFLP